MSVNRQVEKSTALETKNNYGTQVFHKVLTTELTIVSSAPNCDNVVEQVINQFTSSNYSSPPCCRSHLDLKILFYFLYKISKWTLTTVSFYSAAYDGVGCKRYTNVVLHDS